MIHKRCDERITHLEQLLDEERRENKKLQEALVDALQNRPSYVHTPMPGGAKVYYMDDEAMVEFEETGDAPT